MTLDALILINPVATRHPPDAVRRAAEAAFQAKGLRYRVVETQGEEAGRALIRREVGRALAQGCTRIVAVGGDGTISMVAEPLAALGVDEARASLAIVPTGTANVLAHELGIPARLDEAMAIAAAGEHTLVLDAIRAGGRFVLTQVGVGPDALMIRDTSRERQARLGRLAYMITFARGASGYRAHRFALEVDGQPIRVRAWEIVLANAGSFGTPPLTWGPDIDPTDAAADLCIYNVRGARDYLVLAWRVITSRHRRDENTQYRRVRESIRVSADRPLPVQGDGEILGRTPITLEVAPRALRVFVPRPVDEALPSGAEAEDPARVIAAVPPASVEPPTIKHEVEAMITQRSHTWVLQGPLRHPVAAITAFDAAVYLKINVLALGEAAARMLSVLSRVMHYGEGWAIVALVMIAADWRTGLRATVETLPVLWLTMLTVNYPLKWVFRRRRPFLAYVKARVIGVRPRDWSFPSGHTAAAFAGALLLGSHAPGWSPLFYAIALLVGFSRVYLGVHYPSDVLIGAFAGTALATLCRALLRMLLPGL